MLVPARIVIISHLSDLHLEENKATKTTKIEFVKHLVLNYPDTRTEIQPDKEFNEFLNKRNLS